MSVEVGTEEEQLEARHVHQVYSQIAHHFSDTRYKPWPRVAHFLKQLPPGSLVADVGCGNGKYLSVMSEGHIVGCDMCRELVTIASGRGHEVTVADCLNLPFRSNWFDGVISIAVVHHLASVSRRREAVREMVRVVRVGGQILVYVWALEQERKKFSEQDVMVPWHLQPRYSTASSSPEASASGEENRRKKTNKKQRAERRREREGRHRDTEDKSGINLKEGFGHVTTKGDHVTLEEEGYETYQRFYHVFKKGELGSLFNEVGGVKVLEEFYDHDNWCVVAEKVT